jgi:hypothetical protein
MQSRSRHRWSVILGSSFALLVVLILGGVSWWRYVTNVPPFVPPPVVVPQPNGYTQALTALAQLDPPQPPGLPGGPPGYATAPPVGARLKGSAPVFALPGWRLPPPAELQRQMARLRPVLDRVRGTFVFQWAMPPTNDSSQRFPDYARFRECARLFQYESMVAEHQGRYGVAMQRSLDAMELGSRLPHGGGMIPWLTAEACHGIGMSRAERLVWHLPAATVPAAIERVRRIRRQWPGLPQMLKAERVDDFVMWTTSFQSMREEPFLKQVDSLRSSRDDQSLWDTLRLASTPRRIMLANQDSYFRQLIAESRKAVRQRVPVPSPHDAWSEAWPGDIAGTFLERPWTFERVRTHLALLEVALAVRGELPEHGRYVARLSDVSRRWLASVPCDTWDQPIIYRLQSGRPIVYSVGPDGKDDGGTPADPTKITVTTKGDLVLGYLSHRLGKR